MRNHKSLLYGLGSGLILGAVLLQLMNAVPSAGTLPSIPSAMEPTAANLDQKQIKEIASKYYQVFDKTEKLYNQPQLDAALQQKLKEEKDKQAPAPKETYVYVQRGLIAAQVADLLFQSGVISDRKAFEDEMARRQLNDKIVSGVHAFKGPQELQQVISQITTQ